MPWGLSFQADDKVWHIIVRLAVMKVGDSETEPSIFDEGLHLLVSVDDMVGLGGRSDTSATPAPKYLGMPSPSPLTGHVLIVVVSYVAFANEGLEVRAEPHTIRRVHVNHLHLPTQALVV